MSQYKLFVAISLILSLNISTSAQSAIFGIDDRELIRQSSKSYDLSRSTAVAILTSLFEENGPQQFSLYADSLDNLLCESEKFHQNISLPYACSGFLVAPNIIATAGHCMVNTGVSLNETQMYCEAYSWLFDFNGEVDVDAVDKESLYHCKQIIYAINEDEFPYRDFALVELDRPVSGRKPLKISSEEPIVGASLSMIGHPLGMPAVLSKNGRVFVNDEDRQSFVTSLDALSGNSGSAVFNNDEEVVGILIAGTPSPELVSHGTCSVSNTCDEFGQNCLINDDGPQYDGFQAHGSEVQKIFPIQELIKSFTPSVL
jgi:V8-like Glu-specific endopeptidase